MKSICVKEKCDVEIEVTMCCNGTDCGCLGMPTEPPLCVEHYVEWEESHENFYDYIKKND